MRLLPYMQWIRYENLRTVFWKYIPDHHTDGPLRSILHNLHKEGLIEKFYQGTPPATPKNLHNMKLKLTEYLYVRRISKTCPRALTGIHKKLDGTYGIDAVRARARQWGAGKPKPPAKSITTLTLDDFIFIRDNPMQMSVRELAEMHRQHARLVTRIREGHKPAHIKVLLSRLHSADSQADI